MAAIGSDVHGTPSKASITNALSTLLDDDNSRVGDEVASSVSVTMKKRDNKSAQNGKRFRRAITSTIDDNHDNNTGASADNDDAK
jgi:hypothetical protein